MMPRHCQDFRHLLNKACGAIDQRGQAAAELAGNGYCVETAVQRLRQCLMRACAADGAVNDVEGVRRLHAFPQQAEMGVANQLALAQSSM